MSPRTDPIATLSQPTCHNSPKWPLEEFGCSRVGTHRSESHTAHLPQFPETGRSKNSGALVSPRTDPKPNPTSNTPTPCHPQLWHPLMMPIPYDTTIAETITLDPTLTRTSYPMRGVQTTRKHFNCQARQLTTTSAVIPKVWRRKNWLPSLVNFQTHIRETKTLKTCKSLSFCFFRSYKASKHARNLQIELLKIH